MEHRENNYILPFFWQHGEEEAVLRKHMQVIYESGIYAVCVESRPHPDYVGPKWWHDLDIIMDEARMRGMKVWVLDDAHFPTGSAVGKIQSDYPQYQKQFLKLHQQDFVGPQSQAGVLVKWAMLPSDQIIGIVAARKVGSDEIDADSLINLTEFLHEGIVHWDIPEGRWRVFTIVQTTKGGEQATEGYLNPLVPEATRILIDTVYEAHYERYQQDFGNTFAGFFSDEPRFGNVKGPLASIGRFDMMLPWRDDLTTHLQENYPDGDVIRHLPLLWANAGTEGHRTRYYYMDLISRLYGEHFTQQLGDWCREHGVEYIGHVIEDNNAHARLGYGAGHFYRSLWGQDMSGIDVVLHQIMPGMDDGYFKALTATGWDGEFFHYALAKMGASLGHLDPKKRGRTMCEVYGAYGFGEGLKLMKWLTDHMLVRGVNQFVPHAFSPKEYPDPDCPPHLYANGHDPQYRYLPVLTHYINRVSHLLSDGLHIAPAAILYHAEAEWSGDYMLFQKPARELMQHQIDFDVISVDMLLSAKVCGQTFAMNGEQFSTLIIPYAEALPSSLLAKLCAMAAAGIQLYILNSLPERSSEGGSIVEAHHYLSSSNNVHVIDLASLASALIDAGLNEISVSEFQPYLRYYHYQHLDGEVYMFFNEDPAKTISTTINLPIGEVGRDWLAYNALSNSLHPLAMELNNGMYSFELELSKYESIIILQSDEAMGQHIQETYLEKVYDHRISINGEWNVSLANAAQYPQFVEHGVYKELKSLALPGDVPRFSGTVRYEIEFSLDYVPSQAQLLIDEPYEVVQVWLNQQDLGTRICPPYTFDIDGSLQKGQNRLVIEVTNTLVKEQQDYLSQYLIQEPTGIVGSVFIQY
nr:glycosyl hydrolase [Paenibacillus sp. MER 99-2]